MHLTPCLLGVAIALPFAALRGQAQAPERPFCISGELYSRFEFSGRAVVNRLRIGATAGIGRASDIRVELDDVRTQAGPMDRLDIRLASIETRPRPGWRLTIGRQEISSGDERLVGADTRWNPLSPVFDGLSAGYSSRKWRAGGFAAMPVAVAAEGWNRPAVRSLIAGLYASTKIREVSLEPYLLQARGRRRTAGIRSTGVWKLGLDTNFEVALQPRGAWAGHFELGRAWEWSAARPRAWVEYNTATGGARLFDDLYPAGYGRFGVVDPFAWRDIRYAGAGVEAGRERVRVSGMYRRYRKSDGGQLLGSHWIAAAEFAITSRLGVAGAVETYRGAGQHGCELHPVPRALPFLSLTFRL